MSTEDEPRLYPQQVLMNKLVDEIEQRGFKDEGSIRARITEMALTVCITCPAKDKCEFAYDYYNTGVEPMVDCLGAK